MTTPHWRTVTGISTVVRRDHRCPQATLVMHVYLDDSESLNGDGLVCIAGYAAYDDNWQRFSEEWVKLLRRHNLPPETAAKYLHTADFLSGEAKCYRPLGFDGPRRVEIVKEFIAVIRRHIDFGLGVAVDSRAYKQAMDKTEKKKRLPQRAFCFGRAVHMLMNAPQLLPDGETISIVCDDGSSAMHMYGAFKKLRERNSTLKNRLGSLAFADDRFFQPLQAADLLACVTLREHHRIQDKWSDAYCSFGEILKAPESDHGIAFVSELWDVDEILKKENEIISAA